MSFFNHQSPMTPKKKDPWYCGAPNCQILNGWEIGILNGLGQQADRWAHIKVSSAVPYLKLASFPLMHQPCPLNLSPRIPDTQFSDTPSQKSQKPHPKNPHVQTDAGLFPRCSPRGHTLNRYSLSPKSEIPMRPPSPPQTLCSLHPNSQEDTGVHEEEIA